MDKGLISIGKASKLLGISVDTLRRWDKNGKFGSVRIGTKGNRYYRKLDIDLYMNDQLAIARKWALSTASYEPETEHFCKTRDVFQARLEHFQSDLVKNLNSNLSSLISAIVGEIGNNSFDHNLGNWPDILGIYFSYSLSQKKIILAGKPAVRVIYDSRAPSTDETDRRNTSFIIANNRGYIIGFDPSDSELRSIFDKILSTLKFIE